MIIKTYEDRINEIEYHFVLSDYNTLVQKLSLEIEDQTKELKEELSAEEFEEYLNYLNFDSVTNPINSDKEYNVIVMDLEDKIKCYLWLNESKVLNYKSDNIIALLARLSALTASYLSPRFLITTSNVSNSNEMFGYCTEFIMKRFYQFYLENMKDIKTIKDDRDV